MYSRLAGFAVMTSFMPGASETYVMEGEAWAEARWGSEKKVKRKEERTCRDVYGELKHRGGFFCSGGIRATYVREGEAWEEGGSYKEGIWTETLHECLWWTDRQRWNIMCDRKEVASTAGTRMSAWD